MGAGARPCFGRLEGLSQLLRGSGDASFQLVLQPSLSSSYLASNYNTHPELMAPDLEV